MSLILDGKAVFTLSTSLSPSSVGAASTAEQSFTVSGVQVGDTVSVIPPARTNSTSPTYVRVTAQNTLSICFINPTAGGLTPPSGAYTFLVVR